MRGNSTDNRDNNLSLRDYEGNRFHYEDNDELVFVEDQDIYEADEVQYYKREEESDPDMMFIDHSDDLEYEQDDDFEEDFEDDLEEDFEDDFDDDFEVTFEDFDEDTDEVSDSEDDTDVSDDKISPAAQYFDEFMSEDEPEEEKKHRRWWLIPVIFFGLLVVAYCAGTVFFYTHFGAHSTVNGVDCSFKSSKDVEKIIAQQVQDYSLKLIERKDVTEIIKGEEVDLEYVPDGQVKKLIAEQKPYIWPYRLIKGSLSDQNFHASVKLDDKKLHDKLMSMDIMDESKMIPPADSYPALMDGKYGAYPEDEGSTIADSALLEATVKEALLGTLDSVDVDVEGVYENPSITTESPEVTELVDKYNEYIGLTITYHIGDDVEVLDGNTTDGWFTWDENMVPTLNEDAVVEWARGFGQRHDTVGKERTFTNPQGLEIHVSGGLYGWSVDEEAEVNMIKQMFEEKKSQDREPIWEQTADNFSDKDFGNTYIEVNLSTQHMIFWDGDNIVFENDVITGLPTAARETPEGTYFILEMKQNKVLRGTRRPDGSYEYETPVAYWMRVTWTGVGFHDATWQYNGFGGNLYTYLGSHGCINMSYSGAQQLYSLAWVGLPVIIHK